MKLWRMATPLELHYQDERAEIHKLVVGPMDNNVFVLRCKPIPATAVLLDAANEHEKLLELCRDPRRCAEVSRPTATATTSRRVPAVRADAGYQVGVTSRRARPDASVLRLRPR